VSKQFVTTGGNQPMTATTLSKFNGKSLAVKPEVFNLRAAYGAKYPITHDESFDAESLKSAAAEEIALQQIVGKWGHIYPHNHELLAASTNSRGRTANRLLALGLKPLVDADDGLTVLFRPADFRKVAKILALRTRRVLTPERRQALVEAGRKHRFERNGGTKSQL
jgi:hypothetical protein